MPLTWVFVRAPAGQAPNQPVYVNRRFRHPAGITLEAFEVQVGQNTFSLRSGSALTAESVVDCPDAPDTHPVVITLLPIFGAAAMGLRGAPMLATAPPVPAARVSRKRAAKKPAKPKVPKGKAAKKAIGRKSARKKSAT